MLKSTLTTILLIILSFNSHAEDMNKIAECSGKLVGFAKINFVNGKRNQFEEQIELALTSYYYHLMANKLDYNDMAVVNSKIILEDEQRNFERAFDLTPISSEEKDKVIECQAQNSKALVMSIYKLGNKTVAKDKIDLMISGYINTLRKNLDE